MKIPKMVWVIALLLFLATTLNYADRLTLSIVSVDVRKEFGMNEQDYSYVLTLFLIAYAIMYAGSGVLVDRMGTRRGFAFFIFWWSVAQILHALAMGRWSLGACRFMLGLSEPANWPAAAKAIAEWFPASKRALGVGIFNAGSSVGSAIAPPMVAWLSLRYGWRSAFVVTGVMGLVWMVFWLILYQPPHLCRWLRKEEYDEMKDHVNPPEEANAERVHWVKTARERGCWVLTVARFFTDPVIYFMIFWLPEYLRKERGYTLADVGSYAWVPFVFGGMAYLVGGWLSGRLIEAGWPLPKARKFVMLLGAALMPVSIYAPFAPTAGMAIAASCFATIGHAFWVANLQTLPTDLFKGSEIATASGFTGMGGAIGGILANLGTGYVVMHFSYWPIFALAGIMHPLSAGLVYWLLPDRCFGILDRDKKKS